MWGGMGVRREDVGGRGMGDMVVRTWGWGHGGHGDAVMEDMGDMGHMGMQ